MSNIKELKTTYRCMVTAEVDLTFTEEQAVEKVSVNKVYIQPTIKLMERYRLVNVGGQLTDLGFRVLAAGFIAGMANATSMAAMNEAADIDLLNSEILKAIEEPGDRKPDDPIGRYLLRIEEGDVEYRIVAFYNFLEEEGVGTLKEGWYSDDEEKRITSKIKGWIKL
jgi:hypothetical protein